MIVSRWVWSWTGFTQTPAWGSLYRNWAVPLSTTMSNLFIQIFLCLRKLEKNINLGKNMLTFLIEQQYFRYKSWNSVTSSCKEKFTWLAVFLFLWSRVLQCLIRGDGLSFVVPFVTNQIETHPKDAGEDTYGTSGDSDWWGRREGELHPPSSSSTHTF